MYHFLCAEEQLAQVGQTSTMSASGVFISFFTRRSVCDTRLPSEMPSALAPGFLLSQWGGEKVQVFHPSELVVQINNWH